MTRRQAARETRDIFSLPAANGSFLVITDFAAIKIRRQSAHIHNFCLHIARVPWQRHLACNALEEART